MLKVYLLVTAFMSAAAFADFAIDKWRAGKGKSRLPEIKLLSLAAFGGAAGALAGMYILRHKTIFKTKFHFYITVWTAFIIQAALAVLMIRRGL